ncbi:MAG: hypothetical protein ABR981_05085 [Candidatus Micrarchaeaceae archaeon]|jgi:hypothetical protein
MSEQTREKRLQKAGIIGMAKYSVSVALIGCALGFTPSVERFVSKHPLIHADIGGLLCGAGAIVGRRIGRAQESKKLLREDIEKHHPIIIRS